MKPRAFFLDNFISAECHGYYYPTPLSRVQITRENEYKNVTGDIGILDDNMTGVSSDSSYFWTRESAENGSKSGFRYSNR